MIKRTTIIETITLLNIILFLYTGIAKMDDYSVFKEQLTESPVLAPISKTIAILLPILEFLVVLMLAIPRWRLKGLYTTLALMIIFTCYITILLTTSDHLPCSCGGIIGLLSWKQHLIFNGLFILLDIWAIRLMLKEKNESTFKLNEEVNYNILH
ncbi:MULTISPECIES: MauE/DoxX family redox-associated membrane protein [Niastella]|uniref:Methylamine utilisation protein MauE domain-containing protein n=1 Tax=Niastella soli TaxID=2821487 RepID=A0ABS3Z4E3_9BACT|nr:MauE/DoxX family redox-associated membrane protein [Niastella soli]MBO9204612.1 hypothetical protein [Niastella soli]